MADTEATDSSNIKVLSVVWFTVLPPKFGGQKAVAFFNDHLAQQVPLICLCSKNNESIEASYRIQAVLPSGKRQVLNPLAWWKIYATAKREAVTHLLLEFPYYGIAGILCKRGLGVKLVVNTHNIEYRRFKEQKKWWWRFLSQLERLTLQAGDAVFFKTDTDLKEAAAKFNLKGEKLSLIPYGVEEKAGFDKEHSKGVIRQRHSIAEDERILLFAGTLDYGPNAEAVVAICKNLVPFLNQQSVRYKIIVCGRNRRSEFRYLNDLKTRQLIIAGEVDDIPTYFEAADLFINPVLAGGGIQTKTMDALSYHLNVVCFASKATGIANAENKIFPVPENDWQTFADGIAVALQVNEQTSAAFFETYNWRSIAAKAYQEILSC